MAIVKSGKHWIAKHNKTGHIYGRFSSKAAALKQNAAIHAKTESPAVKRKRARRKARKARK